MVLGLTQMHGRSIAGPPPESTALPLPGAEAPAASHALRVLARDTLVAAPEPDQTVFLADRFVVRMSESVWDGVDSLKRGTDYALDYATGALRLLRAEPDGAWLHVRYRVLPLALAEAYAHHLPPIGEVGAVHDSATSAPQPAIVPPVVSRWQDDGSGVSLAHIDVTGTKTFSLEVGSNRDASLRQSLDLALSGTVTPGVTIAGALSDQNIPLTSEGASADLHELDRAWVQVTGAKGRAVFGDFDVTGPVSEFTSFSRRLTGLQATAATGGGEVMLSAAQSRGRWVTVEFFGRDGVQGPYPLLGPGVGVGDIVPGSERVWLDGVQLRRGEGADYTVDDVRGFLTLTPRHLVTLRSRIVVDMQVGEREVSRSFYMGGFSRGGPHGQLMVSLLRESDGRGATGSLSAADKALLAGAGDSVPTATLGVHDVGEGKGDYRLLPADSLGPPRYVYAGRDSGSVRLDFLYVGEGRGDYSVTTQGDGVAYAYAGSGRGAYAIGRQVAPPQALSVLDVNLGAVRVGPLEASLENAVSLYDANTLSPLSDHDNLGRATHLTLGAQRVAVRGFGRSLGVVDVTGDLRDRQARFVSLGRTEQAVSGDLWGVRAGVLERGSRSGTAAVRYALGSALSIGVDAGLLMLPDGTRATRVRHSLGSAIGFGAVNVWREETTTRGVTEVIDRRRDGISVEATRGTLRPSIHLTNEERTGTVRDGAVEWDAGVALAGARSTSISVALLGRSDRNAAAGVGGVHALGVRSSFAVGGERSLSASTEASVWWPQRGSAAPASLARCAVDVRPRSGAVRAAVVGQLSSRALFGDRRDVRFVGVGLGHYDSLGTYVGSGSYDVAIGASSDTARASEFVVSLDSGLDGSRWSSSVSPLSRALRPLRVTQLLTTTVATPVGLARLPWLRGPVALLERPSAAAGEILSREDVEYSLGGVLPTTRYRYERTASRQTPYVNEDRSRSTAAHAVLLRASASRLGSLEAEVTMRNVWGSTTVAGGETNTRATYNVHERNLRLAATHAGAGTVRFDLALNAFDQIDRRTDGRYARITVTPEAAWTPFRATRVSLRLGLTRERLQGVVDAGLGPFAYIGTPRFEYHLSADHRLRDLLTGTVGVDATRYASGGTVQTGRVEVRASF
jgi:hypothetical protein